MNITTEFKPVITRAALALQNKSKPSEFKALVFEEPKYIPKAKQPTMQNNTNTGEHEANNKDMTSQRRSNSKEEVLEFDIKKARQEVLNFAISNQRTSKNKKKMEIIKLVKLGAKPPKKANKNYKVLLDERKRLKIIREERKKFHQLGKNQTGAASVKCRSKSKLEKQKKKRTPVSKIDAHYGIVNPKLKKK